MLPTFVTGWFRGGSGRRALRTKRVGAETMRPAPAWPQRAGLRRSGDLGQQAAQPGHQLRGMKRLAHEGVGPVVQGLRHIFLVPVAAEDDDGNGFAIATQVGAEGPAISIGQREIEQQQVEAARLSFEGIPGSGEGWDGDRMIATSAEMVGQDMGEVAVVFDNQNLIWFHTGLVTGLAWQVKFFIEFQMISR